jgi:hypothetical protein
MIVPLAARRSPHATSLSPRAARTAVTSIRSNDRVSVAEYKIEELEYRLQQERIARLKSENELEALKRASLQQAIAAAKSADV